MISAVLVPLDGSSVAEQAIPYAQALLPDGAVGVLLRVISEVDPLLSELMLDARGVARGSRDCGSSGGVRAGRARCRRHTFPVDY